MKTARLIVTTKCKKKCTLCCNKSIDPIILSDENFHRLFRRKIFEEICITGGEPMLFPDKTLELLKFLKGHLILYTAHPTDRLFEMIPYLIGITITVHSKADVKLTEKFLEKYAKIDPCIPVIRLNIFDNIKVKIPKIRWMEVKHIKWVKDCPLPKHEVLFKLENEW